MCYYKREREEEKKLAERYEKKRKNGKTLGRRQRTFNIPKKIFRDEQKKYKMFVMGMYLVN